MTNDPFHQATACCAVGRADVVGRFFDDVTFEATPEDSEKAFLCLREAITIIFPYLGMPTCIPACYGMIGVVQRKGPAYASTKVLRKTTIDDNDVKKGQDLRSRIYSGVGNSGIFNLMDKYFTDLCKLAAGLRSWAVALSDRVSSSYMLNCCHMGLSDLESQRGSLPAAGIPSDYCRIDSSIRRDKADKEPYQSYTGYRELSCVRENRAGSCHEDR